LYVQGLKFLGWGVSCVYGGRERPQKTTKHHQKIQKVVSNGWR